MRRRFAKLVIVWLIAPWLARSPGMRARVAEHMDRLAPEPLWSARNQWRSYGRIERGD